MDAMEVQEGVELASCAPEVFVGAMKSFWAEQIAATRTGALKDGQGIKEAENLATAMDQIVGQTYQRAVEGQRTGTHALVALGGYGRGRMAPYSDVDLLFLFKREKDKDAEFISGVLHPLWDLGLDIGHSSRTLSETIRMGRQDMQACTAMMDGRFLAGDQALFADFQQRLFKKIPKNITTQLLKWRQQRSQGSSSVQLLEPNVKESPGGLREFDALEWALKAQSGTGDLAPIWDQYLNRAERQVLDEGREFLWRVRLALHLSTGRKHDQLEHGLKPEIAEFFGYTDKGRELAVERFLRHYYRHAGTIYHLVDLVFNKLARRNQGGRSLVIDEGVVVTDEEIYLPQGRAYLAEKPERFLHLFFLVQSHRLVLGEAAQRLLRDSLDLIDDRLRRSPEARDVFLRILRRKHRAASTLRLMHELGVLGAYLPEFGQLTCLVQYDVYHLYTVDEHTLVALDNLELLEKRVKNEALKLAYEKVERRDLLRLGIMLHDVGKSKRRDHINEGLTLARELLERLDLPEKDRNYVLFLIEHHHDIVLISLRRDLDDYRMIAEFAALFPSREWLNGLYLLSYADLSAVAASSFGEWQGALMWELYTKTAEQLTSGLKTLEEKQHARQLLQDHLKLITGVWPPLRIVAFEEHVGLLPPRYLAAYSADEIAQHMALANGLGDKVVDVAFVEAEDKAEIIVCTRDRRQLLAKICGVLAAGDIDILRSDVHTRDDQIAIDIFQVRDIDGSLVLPEYKKERFVKALEEVIAGERKARELLDKYETNWNRRKAQKIPHLRPPAVEFENQVSDRYTVIDVNAQDEVGLLYKITYGLAEEELDIHMAIVYTMADRAVDAFYVTDKTGAKILSYERLETVRLRLLAALEGTEPTN